MDRELLARKLYSERVISLLGDCQPNESILTDMWESKASPSDAAKAIIDSQSEFDGPAWLSRYLTKR